MRKIESKGNFQFISSETFEPTRVGRIRVCKKGLLLCVRPFDLVGEYAAWVGYSSAPDIILYPVNWAGIHVAAADGKTELYLGDSSGYTTRLGATSWFVVVPRSDRSNPPSAQPQNS